MVVFLSQHHLGYLGADKLRPWPCFPVLAISGALETFAVSNQSQTLWASLPFLKLDGPCTKRRVQHSVNRFVPSVENGGDIVDGYSILQFPQAGVDQGGQDAEKRRADARYCNIDDGLKQAEG